MCDFLLYLLMVIMHFEVLMNLCHIIWEFTECTSVYVERDVEKHLFGC